MLSVAKVGSASGAANYFAQTDNYYFLGEASTEWFGKGAEQLGLSGSVDREQFWQVLYGRLQDGSDLSYIKNGENKHRAGYEFVFSAPKSVSLLALVLDDKDVLQAHKNAVKHAMAEIETFASTRTMESGEATLNKTDNIIAALFMHDTNRNLEPQLHTHAIVANATFEKESGKFKTLSSDKVGNSYGFPEMTWNNKIMLGKIYRNFLRDELINQGFEIEHNVGKNGLWEVKGFPKEVLEKFSSRHQEIIDAVGKDASQKSLNIAAKDTRAKKQFTTSAEMKQEWQNEFQSLMKDFSIENVKLSPEMQDKRKAELENRNVNIDKALSAVIADLSKDKAKFGRAEILDKVVDKVFFSGGGFAEQINTRIDQAIKDKALIVTDNKANYFTTPEHLKQESTTAGLIHKLSEQSHNLQAKSLSIIANHLEKNQSNFNLFSVQGRTEYSDKLVLDVQKMATENNKQHIILVHSKNEKFKLNERIGNEPFIYTISDYLKSEYAEKSDQVITFYRADKMKLDQVNAVLTKNYQYQNTSVILDTGERNRKGLARDLALSIGIDEIRLKESAENKNIVIMNEVDKHNQLNIAANTYLTYRVTHSKNNAILQVSNLGSNNQVDKLTDQVRNLLIKEEILKEPVAQILTKEPAYLHRENGKIDYSHASNFRVGYTLEKDINGEMQRWNILDVDRKNQSLTVLNETTGEKERMAMRQINSEYAIYSNQKELEIRVGEKLHSFGKDPQGKLKYNHDYTVVGISKANFFTKQKIILEDEKGKQVKINSDVDTRLSYGYVESVGKSQYGQRDLIISVLQDKQTNDHTLAQIEKGSDRVLAITATSDSILDKRIDTNRPQITVTKGLEQKGQNIAVESHQELKAGIIIRDMQRKGDWYSFVAGDLVSRLVDDKVVTSIKEAQQFVNDKIDSGEYLPVYPELDIDKNYQKFYLKKDVENTQYLLETIEKGTGMQEAILPNAKVLLANTSLNDSQKAAGEMILTSRDQVVNLQGLAGVGKTYQLDTVAGLISEHRPDLTIKALAPTHTAKGELLKGEYIKDGNTFANFLMTSANDETRLDKTIFIIDESSMIGDSMGRELLDSIVNRGGRIVLSGDHKQLAALETGAIFRLSQTYTNANTAEMNEILRQKNQVLLDGVKSLAIDNSPKNAIKYFSQQENAIIPRESNESFRPDKAVLDLSQDENTNLIKNVADDYTGRTEEARNDTIVIVNTNKQRIQVNDTIQQNLLEQGALKNGLSVEIYRRINTTESDIQQKNVWDKADVAKIGDRYYNIAQKEGEIWLNDGKNERLHDLTRSTTDIALFNVEKQTFYQGDKIRLNAIDKNRTTENNLLGTIMSTENGHLTVDFGKEHGKKILDPIGTETDRHFDLGYSATVYSLQGATYKYGIALLDSYNRNLNTLKQFYVGASRVTDHLQIVTDDLNKYLGQVSHSGDRMTAYEVHYSEITNAQKEWDNAKALDDSSKLGIVIRNKLLKNYGDSALIENARLSFEHNQSKAELLLKAVDENGRYVGNMAIPVNPYRGELKFDEMRTDTASNAQFVIIHKGDPEQGVQVLSVDELKTLSETELNGDKSIVIDLGKGNTELNAEDLLHDDSEKLGRISESENMAQQKLEQTENDKLNAELEHTERQKEVVGEIETEKENDDKPQSSRLNQNEVNILRHNDENDIESHQPVKEKELV